jgi:hypothetical protein
MAGDARLVEKDALIVDQSDRIVFMQSVIAGKGIVIAEEQIVKTELCWRSEAPGRLKKLLADHLDHIAVLRSVIVEKDIAIANHKEPNRQNGSCAGEARRRAG